MPRTLYLMCGLAFSGKSTLAGAVAERAGAVLVSLDEINLRRGLHGGLGIPAAEWAATHQIALREAEDALMLGRSVVIDDTNCFRFLRDDYRALAGRWHAATVVVHLDTPWDLVMERRRRNQLRPTRPAITEEVLHELARKFEPPAPDEATLVCPPGADPRAWAAEHILAETT